MGMQLSLGTPIPPHTPHAVSVSLPTWKHNVDYEEGDVALHRALRSGYPRFVYHASVRRLCQLCQERFGDAAGTETALVFPSSRVAQECRQFIRRRLAESDPTTASTKIRIRIVEFYVTPQPQHEQHTFPLRPTLFIVLFPCSPEIASLAKQFWQHSGEGISSRFAEYALAILETNVKTVGYGMGSPSINDSKRRPSVNKRAAERFQTSGFKSTDTARNIEDVEGKLSKRNMDKFVEERYGRNLDIAFAKDAKLLIRGRIAGVIGEHAGTALDEAESYKFEPDGTLRRDHAPPTLNESHVFLFPCGMSAIYNAFRLATAARPNLKTVQFGFPYLDTLKIQQKFGVGCLFLEFGDDNDINRLETLLSTSEKSLAALFLEFPSNPLLKTCDLKRLRSLADSHAFLIVIDETIGNFVNVAVLQYADIVVSSLTKVFSGDSNVMGGSLILNPASKQYGQLASKIAEIYEDNVWWEDAVFLERNSRSFISRIHKINNTALALATMLSIHPAVKHVFYPYFTTKNYYETYKTSEGGYGGLFSVVLKSPESAHAFYDQLSIYKGPSLGTNFTLACPYTILAHYGELDWAETCGVDRNLVRVSVGLEDVDHLLNVFAVALEGLA